MEYTRISDSRVQVAFQEFFSKMNIEEQCTEESLMQVQNAFLVRPFMDATHMYEAFRDILQIKMTKAEFEILFKKINLNEDGFITWDEFVSYLLLEFQDKDTSLQWQMLELPITGLPEILRTRHRTCVCRITFYPEVLADRSTSFRGGCYLTVSKDGTINYWSLDLEYMRSVHSTNPFLKVQPTLITDMIVMPDVQIICTSSTECDLRFYDIVANKFDLRILISSLEDAIVCMNYYFSRNITEDSYIMLGDTNGSIKVMTFCPMDRGPFKHRTEYDVLFLRYDEVVKGGLKGLKVTQIKNVHSNWVSQIAYYGSLRAFMSSSRCSVCSLLFSDLSGVRLHYKFVIKMGISCFNFCEETQTLVTGGPDCIVRVWNPFVPKRPSVIFQGHYTAICAIIMQNKGKRIYSLSKDRSIKVWDVSTQSCIQTYNALSTKVSEYTPMTVIYNPLTHKMIIASMSIAVVICEQVINQEISDGYTHTKPISCVLYNHLHKSIVSTGFDSCIIVWNPWTGHRLYLVTNAHTRLLYGHSVNVEITAACFNTSEQLLLTGARDGSLKIWNFNTGTCLRTMIVEDQYEITSVAWIDNRVLCAGWNRQVTEFTVFENYLYRKNWEIRHTDDIFCVAMLVPQTLATASYNGEIVLWRLETGQPYRIYQACDPTGRYSIKYRSRMKEPQKTPQVTKKEKEQQTIDDKIDVCVHQQSALTITRIVSVRAILFLTNRPMQPQTGTLLVSLESGLVQVWTHHPGGGFLTAFSTIHTPGDCAVSLATDPENKFLFTGHEIGYIKVWYLENYVVQNPSKLCMPLLRIEFPFLSRDRILGRAKRAVRNQHLPVLLSSVRAHMKSINSIQVIPDAHIIISGSADFTVRLWTYGGQYIATLGTFRKWIPMLPDIPLHEYFKHYRLPPDVMRVASYTTLKVLQGGMVKQPEDETKADEVEYTKDIPDNERHLLYGKRLDSPILGNYFKLPLQAKSYDESYVLDTSLTYIPLYNHLTIYPLEQAKVDKLQSSYQHRV